MTHKIVWQDTRNGQKIADLTFESDKQYRLFYFNTEGKPQVIGKLPLRVMRSPMKKFADRWAAEHADEVKVILNDRVPDFSPEAFLIAMEESKHRTTLSYTQEHGKRNNAVVFYIMWEFLMAVMLQLKNRLPHRLAIIWDVEEGGDEIYKILIKGGQNES